MVGRILLALLGVIVLAFFIPVRIRVELLDRWYATVWLFGTIRVWRFPAPEKKKDKPAPPKKTETTQTAKKPSVMDEIRALFHEEGVSGVMSFFAKLIHLLKTTLASLAKFITIRKLSLCVRVGGEEADETAVRYGQLSAALSASLTVLAKLVRVRKPLVRVVPDFTREQTDVRLRMIVWVWPFGVVGVAVAALCKFLLIWMKTMKTPQSGVRNTTNQPKT